MRPEDAFKTTAVGPARDQTGLKKKRRSEDEVSKSLGAPPPVGTVLEDRYRLLGSLGEGGVGWVFRAEHLKLGHEVAIKMLQTPFLYHDLLRPRFEREARALAKLAHPHIVTLNDYSITDGRPYLVMELLSGRTLNQLVQAGPVGFPRARRIVAQVLEALIYAHAGGFAHRDLKPSNIFLVELPTNPDHVKVLDFGFVQLAAGSHEQEDATLTRSGIAFGTPGYMPPEQATGAPTDHRADLYSLGIILFELLAGRRPYVGEIPEVIRQHLTEAVPTLASITAGKISSTPPLREFLTQAMAKEPRDRFQTAEEMLRALRALPQYATNETGDISREETIQAVLPSPSISSRVQMAPAGRSRSGPLTGLRRLVGEVTIPPWVWITAAVASTGLGIGLAWYSGAGLSDLMVQGSGLSVSSLEKGPVVKGGPESRDRPAVVQEVVPVATTDQSPTEPPEPARDNSGESPADDGVPTEAETPPAAPELEERDPWRALPRVALLNNYRRTLRRRALPDRREQRLRDYVREHRQDPRGHLLLAAHFEHERALTGSLQRIRLAYTVDPTARFDPDVLPRLVRLAGARATAQGAADLLATMYGRDAVGEVQRFLSDDPSVSTDPAVRPRMRRLMTRLRRSPSRG